MKKKFNVSDFDDINSIEFIKFIMKSYFFEANSQLPEANPIVNKFLQFQKCIVFIGKLVVFTPYIGFSPQNEENDLQIQMLKTFKNKNSTSFKENL